MLAMKRVVQLNEQLTNLHIPHMYVERTIEVTILKTMSNLEYYLKIELREIE